MAEIIKLSEENIRYRCSFNQSREGVEMICKDRSYKCFDPKFTKDCKTYHENTKICAENTITHLSDSLNSFRMKEWGFLK